MNKVVIIADDFTGANGTGVLLAKHGYKTATFLFGSAAAAKHHTGYQVISINTDSRSIPAGEAYQRVAGVTSFMNSENTVLFSKRIDSTLRGNIGSEIDAVLDTLGPETMAVVVAAYPKSGRVTVGGYLMVDSVPLEKTDAARDPKTPVDSSDVTKLVGKQTNNRVGYIGLETVLASSEAVKAALWEQHAVGNRIVVVDAMDQKDLDTIAKAVFLSGIKVVAVDPGPFTGALAQYFLPDTGTNKIQKVLLVVGSVTNQTRRQLKEVQRNYNTWLAGVDAQALINPNTAEAEINRVTEEVHKKIPDYQIIGFCTVKEVNNILELGAIARKYSVDENEAAKRISDGLARITKKVINRSSEAINALYTSGGDITVAVCQEFAALGVKVQDEVLPLATYGRMLGGLCDDIPIITKGGLVGDEKALCQCIEYLLTRANL